VKLVADPQNPRAQALAERLQPLLQKAAQRPELSLVLGGDGFMLEAIRAHDEEAGTFLGLNCGSLGFLLNQVPEDLDQLMGGISAGRFSRVPLPRLVMSGMDHAERPVRGWAVNDIYLERMTGQTARLQISIDHTMVVDRLVADGLVVSTPLGSTGYAYSGGGVPCHPELQLIQVTPISPHHPRLPSVVVPPGSRISVVADDPERRPVRAVADGVEFDRVRQIELTLEPSKLQLAFLEGTDFTRRLVEKLLRH